MITLHLVGADSHNVSSSVIVRVVKLLRQWIRAAPSDFSVHFDAGAPKITALIDTLRGFQIPLYYFLLYMVGRSVVVIDKDAAC